MSKDSIDTVVSEITNKKLLSDVKKACIAGKDVSAILDERTPHCPRSREPMALTSLAT